MSAEPIRSAKDAINAMYASDSSKRLSDCLANPNAKVASNIHHANRPSASSLLRRAKPRPAAQPQPIDGSVDPLARRAEARAESKAGVSAPVASPVPASAEPAVVRTSLKLGPKKPPRVTAPRVNAAAPPVLRPAKGQISLNPPAIDQRTASAMNAIRTAASTAVAKPAASAKPAAKPVTKPATPVKSASAKPSLVNPVSVKPRPAQSRPGAFQDIIRPASAQASAKKPAAPPSPSRPADSVKNRFRPAPKGYAVAYQFPDSQLDPLVAKSAAAKASAQPAAKPANDRFDLPAFHAASSEPADSAIHIYGMTEGPDESDGWVSPQERRAAADDRLGVVEDYHAASGESLIPTPDEQVVVGRHPAADQDRYAPSEQSPFFLKSVQVDKRPLSAAEQPAKNVYQKSTAPSPKVPRPFMRPGSAASAAKTAASATSATSESLEVSEAVFGVKSAKSGVKSTKSATKAQKTQKAQKAQNSSKTPKNPKATRAQRAADRAASRPTVIIPASRRSHAPLLLLLVITVLLGAIVGSLAYLFLFQ